MPMYNSIEYSSSYSETTGILWFYSKEEATNFNAYIANDNNFKSLKCKTKLLGNTDADGGNGILRNAPIALPLKYLSNFCRSFKIPLIDCKVELKLKWTKYCILSQAGTYNANANGNNIIFTIRDTKLYVPVVTLSPRDDQKL